MFIETTIHEELLPAQRAKDGAEFFHVSTRRTGVMLSKKQSGTRCTWQEYSKQKLLTLF